MDVRWLQIGLVQRLANRRFGSKTLRVRRRNVVGVTALAHPTQLYGPAIARKNEQRRTLADVEPITIFAHGLTDRSGQRTQGFESVQREIAQRIHPSSNDRIAKPRSQEAVGRSEGLGTRGTGCGHGIRWPMQPSETGDELGDTPHLVLRLVVVIPRQCPGGLPVEKSRLTYI